MKKIIINSLLVSTLVFLSACKEPEPSPVKLVEQETVQIPIQEVNTTKNSDFNVENYVKDDEYSRVFTECFATGSTALDKECKTKINKFLKEVPLSKKRAIFIEVHTDKDGSSKKNLYLSKVRAKNTAGALFYKEYLHSRVYYKGFGEEKLLHNLSTPTNNKENRRIVVHVKEKNEKVTSALYSLYVVKKKRVKKQKTKPSQKKEIVKTEEKIDLKNYTGKADTGWIYFGKESLKEKFEISCAEDKPRKVKRSSIKNKKKERFMPGVYKKTFKAKVGNDKLVIAPISVFENGYLTKKNPNIVLTKADKSTTVLTSIVNTYNGEKGMLYRVFVNKKNSPKNNMKCMDIVFAYSSGDLKYAVAYFEEKDKLVSRRVLLD